MPKRILLSLIAVVATFCASAQSIDIERGRLRTECRHKGISRVRTYDIASEEIPKSFEGYRIAFLADIHYESRFDDRSLESMKSVLSELRPNAVLLGGDYQEGCDFVPPLFNAIVTSARAEAYAAVLGNNDIERCTEEIKSTMSSLGIELVDGRWITLRAGSDTIFVAGAENTFGSVETKASPTQKLPKESFVILLTHTPDYAEEQDISHADITLAGHTHGGQVTLFGAIAPVTASRYGQRLLKGLNHTSQGNAVITTTGLGTSRRAIRLFAPSEIILITLHSKQK